MQPKISVIVPIYKVESFLRKCINSILDQTYSNLEIILVDDGSPDKCGEICDRYAKQDSRIRVIHKTNGGLSDARNAALDIATGEYIGFVDSDDWIAPDMYEYLLNGALKYQKDISMCEYYNVYKKDEIATRRYEDEIFDTKSAMEALFRLRIGNYAWNKLFKRELWLDIRFPVGKNYEDVLTFYRILEKSNGIVALKEPKYFYLDNNSGIVHNPSIANKISCVWARMERFDNVGLRYPQSTDVLYREIFRYLGDLLWTVFHSSKTEFETNFEQLSLVCDFIKRNRLQLVSAGNYGRLWNYQLKRMEKANYYLWKCACRLEGVRKKRDTLRKKMNDKFKTKTQKEERLLKYYYRCLKYTKIDKNVALLESRGGEGLASNMYYIAENLVKRGMQVYISVYSDKTDRIDTLFPQNSNSNIKYVYKPSKEYYHAFATAKYLFNDMVYNERIIKREGQIWTNVWHGTPLKCLEYDVENQRHALGGSAREFLSSDYLVAPSRFYIDKMISSAHLEYLLPRTNTSVIYNGYPRNSVFFSEKSRDKIRKEVNIQDKEVFVYMPTWRGTLFHATQEKGEYSIGKIMEYFETHLKEHQILYAKLHNLDNNKLNYDSYSKIMPFPEEYEPYEFLNAADCLITDYSSVFFDFANTRRKIILFCYDKDKYLQDRGLYVPIEALPFPNATTYDELLPELNLLKGYEDSEFVLKYCTYDCIGATTKLIENVIEGKKSGKIEKPSTNGKKNILIYDARIKWRNEKTDSVMLVLDSLKTDEYNYYYAFRSRALEKTPSYLQNLPKEINIYTLPSNVFLTKKEKKLWKKSRKISANTANRELKRALPGMPFDEIRIIDDNVYDAFAQILKTSTCYTTEL